jgi:hypothetical protein
MSPIRKACVNEAVQIWLDQPSLGLLEIANEIRVNLRGTRSHEFKVIPGAEAIRQWLQEAISAGEIVGPMDAPTARKRMNKERRAKE